MDIAYANKLGFSKPKIVAKIANFFLYEVCDYRKADKIYRDALLQMTGPLNINELQKSYTALGDHMRALNLQICDSSQE
jgi:hypothetical protein